MTRRSDILLVGMLFLATVSVMLGYDQDCPANSICALGLEAKFEHDQKSFRSLLYELGLGSIVSLIFYFLLVRLPELQRRKRLRKNLSARYRAFKEKSIALFVGTADGSYNMDLVRQLLEQSEFKRYFKLKNANGEVRWNVVANNLNDLTLRELLVEMEIIRKQINYVLEQIDISDDVLFQSLLDISETLLFFEKVSNLEYDSMKSFMRFYWQVLSGWSWVEGYAKEDVVQKLIDSL